jgi:hypothetical protein
MTAHPNAPLPIDDDEPTRPYEAPPLSEPAAAELPSRPMYDEPPIQATLWLLPDAKTVKGQTAQMPAPPIEPPPPSHIILQPLLRLRSQRILWRGIGTGSALFCLGFLIALMLSAWQPRLHSRLGIPGTASHAVSRG